MKKQVILTSGDIEQIIANSFNVSTDNVDLQCFSEWEGYGTSEHQVPRVRATVEVPMNEGR